MNRSQIYNPSGLLMRAGVDEFENTSVPSSSGGVNDTENNDGSPLDAIVTRPTTQTSARFEMLPPSGLTSNYVPITSFLDKFTSNAQATSTSLSLRVSKLIKSERKMMKQKQNLIKEISSWSNVLPNDECKKLLYHFIKILECELHSSEVFVKKKEQINVQLSNVDKREKRTNELKLRRNKMLVKLRDHENKVGESPITALTKENLEELECSVEIVEEQFIRSINNGLKNSIVDYVLSLQDTGVRYKENSEYFLEHYYFSSTKLNQGSNLQRLILRNKLNQNLTTTSLPANPSAIPIGLSSITSQSFTDDKLAQLASKQAGKYLDNNYDNIQEQYHSLPTERSLPINSQEVKLNPTTLQVSGQDITTNFNIGIPSNPPPLINTERFQEASNHSRSFRDDETANSMVNSYSTPGSLAIRPSAQLGNQHEWTT